MTLTFKLEQNISLTDLYIKDESIYNSNITITGYKIEYKPYSNDILGDPAVYETTDLSEIETFSKGIYIPIENFEILGYGVTSLVDNVYIFTISITYNTDTEFGLKSSTDSLEYFYQGIYNTYTQSHLDYNWTDRYIKDKSNLLVIADEMTRLDNLLLAANNEARPEEFVSILTNLQKYFTLSYDN